MSRRDQASEATTAGGTGRLLAELGRRTRDVVYGEPSFTEFAAELTLMTRVDKAHVVMLAERELISTIAAAGLLGAIEELTAERFEPLRSRPAQRGLYLMYEGYLIERLGHEVGGVLHTGRSRNDLKATITRLRLRDWLLDFAGQAVRLEAILLARARAHMSVLMPAYTHYQAAMPVSYGYYLLGVALAAGREIDGLMAAAAGLEECPLGANGVAGTDLPIDPARTAELLGFATPVRHALDAIASRDVALRLLASATGLAVLLSRLATDLQLWSTAEFGFIRFPDRLVGGSSAMPQKRNAFLLEHVKAKSARVCGAWTAAAAMMAAAPFTNSIEVGTEAMDAAWPGFDAAGQSVLLSQVLVSGARPDADRMGQRATDSFTDATALANRLVRQGVPFRSAHRIVGEAVRTAIEAGGRRLADFGPPGWLDGANLAGLALPELVRACSYGGGPGGTAAAAHDAAAAWNRHRRWLLERSQASRAAEAALAEAVRTETARRARQ